MFADHEAGDILGEEEWVSDYIPPDKTGTRLYS